MSSRRNAEQTRISWTFDGLLLLHATYRNQTFPRHTHASFVVGVNHRSAHRFYCRGTQHYVPPGSIALVNPEEVHTGEAAGCREWRYTGYYPSADWLLRLWQDIRPDACGVPMFTRSTVRDGEIARSLRRLCQMIERNDDVLAIESASVRVFTDLLCRHGDGGRKTPTASKEKQRVHRMREFLHANLAQPITLEMLAAAGGLGRFGALKAFRRELGLPPYAYLTSLRLERARDLLLTGETPAAAAQVTGFADQSHLTRRFKRHFGVTPGAFARAVSRSSPTTFYTEVSDG